MLVTALAGGTEDGQAFMLALYFNSTRWYETIGVHVPAYQASTELSRTSKKPKTEFHAIEARPASNSVLEWELTFAKQFLKSYGRILTDWVRDNVKSLIERHQQWLNSPPPVVTDVMALVAATEPSTAPPITALQSGANRIRS